MLNIIITHAHEYFKSENQSKNHGVFIKIGLFKRAILVYNILA